MKNITKGTKVKITGQNGHFFDVGTEATIISSNGGGYYHAEARMGAQLIPQLISDTDFEVLSEQPQSKGDDTLTNTFEVGQQVRITGAKVDPIVSMLLGKDITTHSLPIGAVTKIIEVENEDGWARLAVDGLQLTHEATKPGPQWVQFEYIEDATGTDLSKDGEEDVVISSGAIKPGDEVTIIDNRPCMMSKMMHGMDRGMHGVEIGRTLTVLEADEDRVIVDTRFEVLADEHYNQDRQAIPLSFVLLASARTDSASA